MSGPTFSGALHKLNKELTKATKTIASDETFRAVVDKTQGVMAFDSVKKAVVKATSREAGPPKEKHVQFLQHSLSDPSINIVEVLNDLFARLRIKDATIVLKTLMVFHRFMRDCPPSVRIYQRLFPSLHEFRIPRFLDDTSNEGMQASLLVRNYALYMEEKLQVVRETRFDYDQCPRESVAHMDSMDRKRLRQDLFTILPQLAAAHKCSLREEQAVQQTTVAAFGLIFKDARILYQVLNHGVLKLLEGYFESEREEAAEIVKLYKEYLEHTTAMERMMSDARDLLGLEEVELSKPPDSFLSSLEAYLHALSHTAADPAPTVSRPALPPASRPAAPLPAPLATASGRHSPRRTSPATGPTQAVQPLQNLLGGGEMDTRVLVDNLPGKGSGPAAASLLDDFSGGTSGYNPFSSAPPAFGQAVISSGPKNSAGFLLDDLAGPSTYNPFAPGPPAQSSASSMLDPALVSMVPHRSAQTTSGGDLFSGDANPFGPPVPSGSAASGVPGMMGFGGGHVASRGGIGMGGGMQGMVGNSIVGGGFGANSGTIGGVGMPSSRAMGVPGPGMIGMSGFGPSGGMGGMSAMCNMGGMTAVSSVGMGNVGFGMGGMGSPDGMGAKGLCGSGGVMGIQTSSGMGFGSATSTGPLSMFAPTAAPAAGATQTLTSGLKSEVASNDGKGKLGAGKPTTQKGDGLGDLGDLVGGMMLQARGK